MSKVFEICHQNLNSVRFLVNSNLTARVTTATNAAKGHVAVEHHFSEHQCYVCANSDQAGELTAERLRDLEFNALPASSRGLLAFPLAFGELHLIFVLLAC